MQPQEAHTSGLVAQLLSVFLYVGSEWVMYLLIALSVVSLGIALERLFFFTRRRTDIAALDGELTRLLQADKVPDALKLL